MSRKSDISQACRVYEARRTPTVHSSIQMDDALYGALEAAYDLGRAAQAEADSQRVAYGEITPLRDIAKRLRARVRKLTEPNTK